jgi:hypothetical protein
MMTDDRAAALTPKTGKPTARWWRYLKPRRMTCADGHHFSERARFPESGFLRCEHWIAAEHRECGRWIFIYAIRGGGCVVAEVSMDERDEMDELLTPAQMIEYLGIFDQLVVVTPSSGAVAVSSSRPPARSSNHDHRRR